jgi:hypothetical protein
MASPQCALQGVIALYSDLAQNPSKDFGWDKGLDNARNHGYKPEWIDKLPRTMWDYCAGSEIRLSSENFLQAQLPLI